jgi:hypothetical protein
MRDVHSSHVSRIGYDAKTKELHVEWGTDKVSVYSGVPAGLADEVMNSWSVGKALTDQVKGKFGHRYA